MIHMMINKNHFSCFWLYKIWIQKDDGYSYKQKKNLPAKIALKIDFSASFENRFNKFS